MSRGTLDLSLGNHRFVYWTVTLFGGAFQLSSTTMAYPFLTGPQPRYAHFVVALDAGCRMQEAGLFRCKLLIVGLRNLFLISFPSCFFFLASRFLLLASSAHQVSAPVWALPCSLAATGGIDFSFSSSGYLDVSVPLVYLLVPMD